METRRAATRNPHRASARKLAPRVEHSRTAWCGQVRRGRIRSGGASSALPSLACLWPSEARVCSPHPDRVAVYLLGLSRTPEATQDDAKEEIHLRQGPGGPWVVTAGCRHWCVFVTIEGSSTTQSPRPGEMATVTRRRRRRRVRRAQPKLLEEPAFVFSGFHTSINDEGGRHAAPS